MDLTNDNNTTNILDQIASYSQSSMKILFIY